MTAFLGGAIFVAEVCALSVVPRFEVAVLNRKLVAAESASSWSTVDQVARDVWHSLLNRTLGRAGLGLLSFAFRRPCGVGEMTLEQLLVFVAVERQHVTPRITKEPQREGQEAGFD